MAQRAVLWEWVVLVGFWSEAARLSVGAQLAAVGLSTEAG